MKNLFKLFLALFTGIALTLFVSCSDDDDTNVDDTNVSDTNTDDQTTDTTAPTVTISSPVSGSVAAAGGSLVPDISVADETELASATLSIGNGTVTVISADIDITTGAYSTAITLPENVVLGNHTITVTAIDVAGNSTTDTVGIVALPKLDEDKLTIILQEVPTQPEDYSNDPIYMIGSMPETGPWDLSKAIQMEPYTDSEGHISYYGQFVHGFSDSPQDADREGIFKFLRGPIWSKDGRLDNGTDYGTPTLVDGTSHFFADPVFTWQDYNPGVTNKSDGAIIVVDGIPLDSTYTLSATVKPAASTESAITEVSYLVKDSTNAVVMEGLMANDSVNDYSAAINAYELEIGAYTITISALDAAGATNSGDKVFAMAAFPCDDSGIDAVASTMTRFVVNVAATDHDVYATGSFMTGNNDGWGGVDADGTMKMTKISDGCYYVDFEAAYKEDGTTVIDVYKKDPAASDEATCQWWKDAAKKTSDGQGGQFTFSEGANSGKTYKGVFGYWNNKCDS